MIAKRSISLFICTFIFFLTLCLTTSARITPKTLTDTPHLTFSASGCHSDEARHIFPKSAIANNKSFRSGHAKDIVIEVRERNITFSHELNYICCAYINLESKIENNIITIVERNEGDRCRCDNCEYSINASFGPLEPGEYQLQVYGVEEPHFTNTTEDPYPPLLFQSEVRIK